MARTILEFTYNRNRGVKMTPLDTSFLTGDKNGHEFRIKVIDDQGNVDLSGESVSGWMIPDDQGRSDDTSVPLTGRVEGNVAILTLSEDCYRKIGRFSLVIKAGADEELGAIFWATGSMLRTHTDTIAQTETIKDLDTLLAQIAAMEAATADARAATEEVRAVLSDEGNEQVTAIREAGTEQVAAIENAGTTHLNAINTAGETQTNAVNTAGATQVQNVNTAGANQLAAIENKGANTLATIPADYTQVVADVSSLKDTIGYKTTGAIEAEVHAAGTYISAEGKIFSLSAYSIYKSFEAKAGQIIKFYARGETSVSVLSKTDASQSAYTSIIVPTDTLAQYFEHKVEEDGYYAICSRTVVPMYEIVTSSERLDAIEKKFNTLLYPMEFGTPDVEQGYYIHSNGRKYASFPYSVTAPVYVPVGFTIKLNAHSADAGVISMLTEYVPSTGEYKPLVVCTDTSVSEYSYIPEHPTYIVVTFHTAEGYSVKLIQNFKTLASYVSELSDGSDVLPMFNEIICIGDSLTYSQVYTSAGASRQAYQPYPKVLEKRTGTPTEIFARAGATPESWWDAFSAECMVERTNACYLVYLGTNGNGLTDTIAEDCPTESDMTAWAETQTGYYGRILQSIANLGAKAILIKVYAAGGAENVNTTNGVIEQFGERFGFPVAENQQLNNAALHCYPDKSGTNAVHYNDVGYVKFTDQLLKNIAGFNSEQLAMLIPN